MKVVIIHGTFWNPEENWFPWLKQQLEKQGHKVRIPRLPTPDNQTPSDRCNELQKQVPFLFDKETVLIGHSLWAVYLLHILDRERKEPIKKAIFVSGFLHLLWNEKFDSLNKPFVDIDFNWDRIRNNVKDTIVFHWNNDPYVPLSEAEYLNKKLHGKLFIINWWGHLNEEAWYKEFQQLLDNI